MRNLLSPTIGGEPSAVKQEPIESVKREQSPKNVAKYKQEPSQSVKMEKSENQERPVIASTSLAASDRGAAMDNKDSNGKSHLHRAKLDVRSNILVEVASPPPRPQQQASLTSDGIASKETGGKRSGRYFRGVHP